jgi:hypothetical protein
MKLIVKVVGFSLRLVASKQKGIVLGEFQCHRPVEKDWCPSSSWTVSNWTLAVLGFCAEDLVVPACWLRAGWEG